MKQTVPKPLREGNDSSAVTDRIGSGKRSDMLFLLLVAVVLTGSLLWFSAISQDYPFYFVWDMDLTVSLDTLLVQSELLPDHLHHPGFGMNLFLVLSQKAAHSLGILSIIDLQQLDGCPNPLAAMAEHTDFLRGFSPLLAVCIPLILTAALLGLCNLSRWHFPLIFLVLVSQESLTINATMIRSEFYAVFFWSLSLLVISLASGAGRSADRWLLVLAGGLCLGLTLLTKVQAFFSLAAGTVLLFSFSGNPAPSNAQKAAAHKNHFFLFLSALNLVIFVGLAVFSYRMPLPEKIPVWADEIGVSSLLVAAVLAFLALLAGELFVSLRKQVHPELSRCLRLCHVAAAGFLIAFALHFLLYADAGTSWHYLLHDFKMMFLRKSDVFKIRSIQVYITQLIQYIGQNPVMYLINIVLVIGIVFGTIRRRIHLSGFQFLVCLALTFILYVNTTLATRPTRGDVLWREILLNVSNLYFLGLLLTRIIRPWRFLSFASVVLLGIAIWANLSHTLTARKYLDSGPHEYGWKMDKWFRPMYAGNQVQYGHIMQNHYPTDRMKLAAEFAARDHERIRRTVDFVFRYQTITHQHIGVVLDGFPVWSEYPQYKITGLSEPMKGQILVDAQSVPVSYKRLYRKPCIGKPDAPTHQPPPAGTLPILTRSDLQVLIFVTKEDLQNLAGEAIAPTSLEIHLARGKDTLVMHGMRIKDVCNVPMEALSQKCFFVLFDKIGHVSQD